MVDDILAIALGLALAVLLYRSLAMVFAGSLEDE
jgi:hypothetical protein